MNTESNLEFTRPGLCRHFLISDRTLTFLEARGIIELSWVRSAGVLRTSVSEDQARVLECSRAHVDSFRAASGIRILPFHRIIALRSLCYDADDLYDDILFKNCLSYVNCSKNRIVEYRAAFLDLFPEDFIDLIKKPELSERTQKDLNIILKILGIEWAYEHPEAVDLFSFLSDEGLKTVIDVCLSSKASVGELSQFLNDAGGLMISPEGLLFYKSMFFDLSLLSADEVFQFIKAVRPSTQTLFNAALGTELTQVKVALGLHKHVDSDTVLELARQHVVSQLVRTIGTPGMDANQAFDKALKNFLLINDHQNYRLGSKHESKANSALQAFRLREVGIDSQLFHFPAVGADVSDGTKG